MAQYNLLVQAAVTLAMVAVIWFVQVVHYPLFRKVGLEQFAVRLLRHFHSNGWKKWDIVRSG